MSNNDREKLLHSVGETEEETLVINNLPKNVRESALAPITFKVFFSTWVSVSINYRDVPPVIELFTRTRPLP